MRKVPDLLRDRRRLDEEFIGRVGLHFSGPGQIDHRVDQHVGHVNPFRTELARYRLGENPLRRFGRSEAREIRLPALDDVCELRP